MKVNIKQNMKNSDVLLSIGMIVKNEEKVLRRCLESLKPLMEQISCELIIADTGSTDSTVEIAREYTENVFHFEWINDFAAARNSTLDRAKGQWYMFIDADEYLDEDISEIVRFFNIPELRNKYKTLEIMIRSYNDESKTVYADACIVRFQRIDDFEDPVRFIGSIHENLPIRQPMGYFSTILHHTGYAYASKKQSYNKKKRNLVSMREEFKQNPDDLRIISHLIDGCANNRDEASKYIEKGMELVQKNRRHMYANVFFVQSISFYSEINPHYALELSDKYFEELGDECYKYVATIAVFALKSIILSALAKYDEAIDAIKKYMELYRDYKNDKMIITDISAHPVCGLSEPEYYDYVCTGALCLEKLKRYDEAIDFINCLDFDKLNGGNFKAFLGTIREICKSKKDYVYLAKCYGEIMKLESEDKKNLILYTLESIYYSLVSEEERRGFANDIVSSGASGKYIDLMKLVIDQIDNEAFKNRLLNFVGEIDNWKDGYSEAIYLSIKYGLDISETIERIDALQFRTKLEQIAYANDDFAEYVYNYGVPESFTTSIKKFYWITSLYEKASYRSFELDDNRRYELYNRFVSLLGDYVMNIYNPELLNDEDIQVIPNLHKFGFYMYQAQSALSAGDSIGYIRGMKKALINCESMKAIVEFMLEQFKKKIR